MEQQGEQLERRDLSRFNLRLRSILKKPHNGEEDLELFTRDVSSKGAFFLTSNPLPIDTTLAMTLFLPVGKSAIGKIGVAGRVVRTEGEGMAVRFDPGYTLVPV
jgi:hypothetical protein